MSKAREVALKVLKEVNADGKYVNISLKQHLDRSKLDDRDVRLATQLVYGTLEKQMIIDNTLKQFTKLKRPNPWVENILRMGCYQILYLDKIPDSAACNEAVGLCKKYVSKSLAGFVNGVLRNIVRNKDRLNVQNISTFPSWIIEKWKSDYGADLAEQMTDISSLDRSITIRVNRAAISKEDLANKLQSMGIEVKDGLYLEEALRVQITDNIGENPLYKKGFFTVQGESSMLVAHIVNPKADELILDACSAPGGKAIHMAELMGNRGKIYAWDVHPHRIELIKRNCQRMGVNIINAEKQDARFFRPDMEKYFDRVLIDAPCSGLGVAHHKPDISLKITTEKLSSLSALQWDIISTCSRYVKPGGILVYSTCTINYDENEKIINRFLNEFPDFVLDDFSDEVPDYFKKRIEEAGMIRLTPGRDGLDGFFIARMRRKNGNV